MFPANLLSVKGCKARESLSGMPEAGLVYSAQIISGYPESLKMSAHCQQAGESLISIIITFTLVSDNRD